MENVYTISWQVFLLSFVSGAISFIPYDVLRFFRKNILKSKVAIYISDIIFMCIFALITYFFALAYNFGIIRIYMIFAEILSIITLINTIGRVTNAMYSTIYSIIYKFFKKTYHILIKSFNSLLKNTHKIVYNLNKKNKSFHIVFKRNK